MQSQSPFAILIKVVLLGAIDAVAVWAGIELVLSANYSMLAVLVVGTGLLNALVLSKKAYPFRYMAPALVFLFGMVVYPILYTGYVSLTNLQTGNLLPKHMVIETFENRFVLAEDAEQFTYSAFVDEGDGMALVLESETTGERLLYENGDTGPLDMDDPRLTLDDEGTVTGLLGYEPANKYAISSRLDALSIPFGDYVLRHSLFKFSKNTKQYSFDESSDTLTDLTTGAVYSPIEGTFTSEDGTELEPGFQAWIGFRNFGVLFSNAALRKDFGRVFAWTIVWSLFSVFLSFSLGLGLALLLNDRKLRARVIYRTLLIVPYVMPVFISALVWRGMFNTQFGIINRLFNDLFGVTFRWLDTPMLARGVLIFINVWLSFPYMMLISLGALQSIPGQLYEAARVDGAGMFRRFSKVTLPLLMISLAPLLIGSFAFAFNNFTLIYLVTAGRPAVLGAASPAGATDILISWTYRIAFQGGSGNQLGLASAVSILIFVMIGTMSAIGFRFTKRLEEVYK